MIANHSKFAVIGTGAAALGVLTSLLEKSPETDIVVYDIGRDLKVPAFQSDNPSQDMIESFYGGIYKEIRSLYPFKFPPPKTHFGEQIPRQPVGRHLNIFKSESFGGLTNYWGSTMLPFTDREMVGWPIEKEALYPYYQKIAEITGLAASSDNLNEYFIKDFATNPAIKSTAELDKLNQTVNSQKQNKNFKIVSGLNRCAVQTRKGRPNSCVYCGECLAGCFCDSIYSARFTIREYLKDSRVRYVKDKVKRINKQSGSLEIETEKGGSGGFSRVFLCAGCPNSTEIVMRSLGLRGALTMADNAVYVFPIFYFGKKLSKDAKSYLSLCNIIFGCIPKAVSEHFAQAQIYPNFDYLWRYNISPKLWPIIGSVVSYFRPRIFWGRLFLHSDYSQSYSLELKNDRLIIDEAGKAESGGLVKTLMSAIRGAANHNGFYIPPIPPIRQKVNSHYAATLPFQEQIMPNVYLCDSSTFPNSPAVNPGFTIMANAFRIADQIL